MAKGKESGFEVVRVCLFALRDYMQLFFIEFHWFPVVQFLVKCPNWTDLYILAKSVFVEQLKTSIADLQRTNCLGEFRFLNE